MKNNITFEKLKRFSPDTGISLILDDNIGIKMNEQGFYEEYIKDKSKEISDSVLRSSTHYPWVKNEYDLGTELYGNINNINFNNSIGYYKNLFIGHTCESDIRKNSSSGGMATWILKELLQESLIDGVIHVGTGDNEKLFEYKLSHTIEEVEKNSKTRYYPVELSKVLREISNMDGKYAIIGIPSFISSIRLLQQIDPHFEKKIVYTVGLVCGHQKSSSFSDYMGWQVGIIPGQITYIDYRVKLENQPSNKYGIRLRGKTNKGIIDKTIENYKLKGQNWGKGYFKKEESDFVDDVFNETADITLGDAWLPKYDKDYKGNNIIITRNETIDSLIMKGIKDKRLNLNISNETEILQSQIAHLSHTQKELDFRIKRYTNGEVKRRNYNKEISMYRKIIQKLRHTISIKSNEEFVKAREINNLNYFESKMKLHNSIYDSLYTFKSLINKIIKR